jgi:hypothetical protein
MQEDNMVDTLRAWQARWMWVAVLLVVVAAPLAVASQEGQIAVEQVTTATYRQVLGDAVGVEGILYTHVGDNRGFGPEHDLAQYNIWDRMMDYGLTVTLEPVSYSGNTYYNVVGKKTGTVYPDQEYIIGAHYDSVNNPGADDNASGVTAVLESARVITQYDSDYTIRFIAFDREEQGLYGSHAYVNAHSSDDILAMLSLDMLAYNTGQNYARIYKRSQHNPLMNALGAAIEEYSGGITWTDAGWISASDHAPFSDAGIPAALLIEGEVWDNPHYHTQQDAVETPGNIDYVFATNMTRGVLGWLVDTALVRVPVDSLGFTYPEGHPEYILPSGGTTMMVQVYGIGTEVPQPGTGRFHYNTGSGWEDAPMTQVAANLYEVIFPAIDCLETMDYYFSAQALSGTWYYDPRVAPDGVYSVMAIYGIEAVLENTFDGPVSPGWSTEGSWAYGTPTGQGGSYGGPDPTAGYTGDYVYGYNLNGDYERRMPERDLTTTAIDCSELAGTHLTFYRWLGVEDDQYDHAYIRISTNGSTWTTIWENTVEIADTTWQEMTFDISTYADGEPTVYLKWVMGTSDGGWEYCGWNIDDITIYAMDCTPNATGDHDSNGVVDLYDFSWMQDCFSDAGASYPPAMGCEVFDFNQDGDIDADDYDSFYPLFVAP